MYDLVVAKYSENLDWIADQAISDSRLRRIFVYSKNGQMYNNDRVKCEIINNVGRESHTYLYHIINNYDNLSDRVIFTQAKFNDHIRFNDFFRDDYIGLFGRTSNCYNFRLVHNYTYLLPNQDNFTFGEWMEKYIDPDDKYYTDKYGRFARYGACFTVAREDILSRPLDFYKKLIKQLETYYNPEVGHFFERAWYYIFNLHKKNIYNAPHHIIVGAGISGLTIAERIASNTNANILIIEKRDHIGGNCYDYKDKETDILVSKYGAHIFHTKREDVWEYVNRFSNWTPYQHKVYGVWEDEYFPIPINIKTINILCGTNIGSEQEMKDYLDSVRDKTIIDPKNSEEYCLSKFGNDIYEKVIKHYTFKQWNKYPNELDVSVLQRIPIRYDFTEGYFTDKYQALPTHGYTHFTTNMGKHKNIYILYNTNYHDIINMINVSNLHKVWYTGPIDLYYADKGMEKLEYRSINFEWNILKNLSQYQPYPVVNYTTNDTLFTRIVEYKNFLNQPNDHTIISREYTTDSGDPYYPIINERNLNLYKQYKKYADEDKDIVFVGRLASYKYYNMDEAIGNSLDTYQQFINDDTKNMKYIRTDNTYNYVETGIDLERNHLIRFKTTNDAHIGLFDNNELVAEIVIGGWNNSKSVLRCGILREEINHIYHNYCNENYYVSVYVDLNDGELIIRSPKCILLRGEISNKNKLNIRVSSYDRVVEWKI